MLHVDWVHFSIFFEKKFISFLVMKNKGLLLSNIGGGGSLFRSHLCYSFLTENHHGEILPFKMAISVHSAEFREEIKY